MRLIKWVLLVFFISCTGEKSEYQTEEKSETEPEEGIVLRPINIYEKLPDPIVQIDSLFEFVDLVPFEVPESAFLSSITKLKLVGSEFLVFDKKQLKLMLFDKSGKFIRTYGSKGEGPGEYLDISDFEVFDGKVYLMSRGNQALLVYDVDSGEFLEKIPIGIFGDKLASVGNGEFVIYVNHNTANDHFNIYRIDSMGNILDSYFRFDPKKETMIITISGFMTKSELGVNFSKPFHDTVYTYDVEGKDFKAKYHTDLLSEFMVENQRDFMALASPETLVKSVRGGESMNGNYLLENKDYLVFNFLDYSTFKSGVFDKENSEFSVFAYISENPIFRLFDDPQVLTDDNLLYFPVYGEKVMSDDFINQNFESEFQSKLVEKLEAKGKDYPYFICVSRIR
ncbi:6-bladed beta-propeller [Algoriphagus machipongonensis]|uniref:Uncharacterized protein n=1 Tax=Algoriphagus machipongonensis TaxID=388413 RepID=A3HZT0_9BACT|nr:6-bladed beta-propeller [Algoriphagus machipongonensis]EAZ80766.1 hypothetical protein ALPR1_07570 [Algoriphagus machipongonensis]